MALPEQINGLIKIISSNPLKMDFDPNKFVHIKLFYSEKEIIVFSIVGLFGLVGVSGLFSLYKFKNKRKK